MGQGNRGVWGVFLVLLAAALAGASASGAAEGTPEELWSQPFPTALRILDRALANPEFRQTDAYGPALRVRQSMPFHYFDVIFRNAPNFGAECLRLSADGRGPVEIDGAYSSARCEIALGQGSFPRCRIIICPKAFVSPAITIETLVHEATHATEGVNECRVTYLSLMALAYGGGALPRNGYVEPCGLGPWLDSLSARRGF